MIITENFYENVINQNFK